MALASADRIERRIAEENLRLSCPILQGQLTPDTLFEDELVVVSGRYPDGSIGCGPCDFRAGGMATGGTGGGGSCTRVVMSVGVITRVPGILAPAKVGILDPVVAIGCDTPTGLTDVERGAGVAVRGAVDNARGGLDCALSPAVDATPPWATAGVKPKASAHTPAHSETLILLEIVCGMVELL